MVINNATFKYMQFKDCNVIVIHDNKHTDRHKYVNNIKRSFKKTTIKYPITPTHFDKHQLSFWLDIHNFKRMPSMHQRKVMTRVSCFMSHIEALEHAIKNKLNNVIVFEDDAIIDEDFEVLNMDIDDEYDIIYLGYDTYYGNKHPINILAHAIYYKSWDIMQQICDYAYSHVDTLKSWDLWLSKYIAPQFNVLYTKLINQASYEKLTGSHIGY